MISPGRRKVRTMSSREFTNTSLRLIKEKIIKTHTVLNIVCEKNATILDLHSKLDLASSKFIKKCQELNQLQEHFKSRNKELYTLSSKLVDLQDQHNQLSFDACYAQSQYNIGNNESYLKIQILEADLIKLNSKINVLQQENELMKPLSGSGVQYLESDLERECKVKMKDFKVKNKILQEDLKESKKLHNNCLKELLAIKENCKQLQTDLDDYRNNGQTKNSGKCSLCSSKGVDLLFNKSLVKFADLSTQTEESDFCEVEAPRETFSSPEKILIKGIDVDEKVVRIRQLKTELFNLKNETMKIVNEKRVLQTDLKCLQHENMKFLDENEQLKLERDSVVLENQLKSSTFASTLLSLEKIIDEDYSNVEEQDVNDIAAPSADIIEDLGLTLSSDSESETEFESYEDMLQQMVIFRTVLSPIPKSPKLSNSNQYLDSGQLLCNISTRKIESREKSQEIQNDWDSSESDNIVDVFTQTDFDIIIGQDDCKNLSRTDFGSQTVDILINEIEKKKLQELNVDMGCQVEVLMAEKEVQCDFEPTNSKTPTLCKTRKELKMRKYKKDGATLKKALRILRQANYDVVIKNCKIKSPNQMRTTKLMKENLKSSLEIFRKYSMNMLSENDNLISLENRKALQVAALTSFMFSKLNKKFRDSKNVVKIGNTLKLSAAILNGVNCDKKAIENSLLIDNEIKEIAIRNASLKEQRLGSVLDEEMKLRGFAETVNIANRPDRKVSAKRKASLQKKIKKIISKKDKKDISRRASELRNTFELEVKENEASKRKLRDEAEIEIKKPKLSYISAITDNKDNVSVDCDSGFTDGSETSEIPVEIEVNNTRILRSSAHKRNINTLPPISNTKKRRISTKDLFGSDADSSEDEEILFIKKSPVKKKKATVLDKFRKAANIYNRRSQRNIKTEIIEDNMQVKERQSVNNKLELEKGFARLQNQGNPKIARENLFEQIIVKCEELERKICVDEETKMSEKVVNNQNDSQLTEKPKRQSRKVLNVENAAADSKIILENKEELMQRFISDIPIIKPPQKVTERTVFKKPLRRTASKCNSEINIVADANKIDENDILIKSKEDDDCVEDGEISAESDTQDSEANENSDGAEEEEEKDLKKHSDCEAIKLFSKLIEYNCEESIVQGVYDKVCDISTQHISSLIIHALYKYRSQEQEPSHTPFAPHLSPAYKTIIGFAIRLSQGKRHENIFSIILDQLETEFLSHNNAITKNKKRVRVLSLEPLFRFYVSVCMLKTEVLRLRLFVCDMAYYQRDGWYGLMFSLFTVWPSVLPKRLDENEKPLLREHDGLLMQVLMFFVFKKRNSEEYMYYRPFLTTFAFGYYKYESDSLHIKLIFDELVEKFTTTESDVLAYAITILVQRITNTEFLTLLRSESFNNVFKASDEEKLNEKAKLLWLLDRIIPEISRRGDRKTISTLESILENLQTRVENVKVKNFIQSCIGKLSK